jgi:hypothetical protein
MGTFSYPPGLEKLGLVQLEFQEAAFGGVQDIYAFGRARGQFS